MKKIETNLKEELEQLKQVPETVKQRLINIPEGTLRVRNWNGKTEYYYRNCVGENAKESRSNGRYLKTKAIVSGYGTGAQVFGGNRDYFR